MKPAHPGHAGTSSNLKWSTGHAVLGARSHREAVEEARLVVGLHEQSRAYQQGHTENRWIAGPSTQPARRAMLSYRDGLR